MKLGLLQKTVPVMSDSPMNLQSITLDVFKYILSFSNPATIASIARTSKDCYVLTREVCFDSVHHVAMIDPAGNYQIKYISSEDKHIKSKNLITMTCIDNLDHKSVQYLLENSMGTNSFSWAKFVSKKYRFNGLNGTDTVKGYWKLLNIKNHNIVKDLNAIKSLVMHKQIATKLLKYDYIITQNHFNVDHITLIVNNNKYDIYFWNGASPNECNTFQIYDYQKQTTRYYMNFRSDIQKNIKWMWYDNDSSEFSEYCLGSKVKAQIECSFQSNLLHNFPLEFQQDSMFHNLNLTELKKSLIARFGNAKTQKNKIFILRFRFNEIDNPNRLITRISQLAVSNSSNDCYTFSRAVERVNCNNPNQKNGICQNDFHLRMMPDNVRIYTQNEHIDHKGYKLRLSTSSEVIEPQI